MAPKPPHARNRPGGAVPVLDTPQRSSRPGGAVALLDISDRRLASDGGAPAARRPAARKTLERETGFEPATPSLEGWRSTAELFPQSIPLSVVARGRPGPGTGPATVPAPTTTA